VLSQEGVAVRVLIIDDASSDETPAVARQLADRDPRVESRRHATNRGHIATYNEGLLGWAGSDYSLLLSADDLLTPGALRRAARLLDAHPEVGMVHGRMIPVRGGRPAAEARSDVGPRGGRVVPGPVYLESCCATATANYISSPTVLVRTDLQQALGGYRAELPFSGDMEMWLRFAAHAAIGVLDADQAYYRIHDENMHHRCDRKALGDLADRKAALDVLFRDFGERIADRGRLRELADRALAQEAAWAASLALDRGEGGAVREHLEFAERTWPAIRSWPHWSRLRWKRALGPRVWPRVRVGVDWLRTSLAPAPGRPAAPVETRS
jgi:glycosyltransferase involved in cell wall biosynthesis